MDAAQLAALSAEHRDFYQRFQSFWAAPSGPRVAELIAPDAVIQFTGFPTMTGADYAGAMGQMLAASVDLTVTPLDCAGNGDRLYISWRCDSRVGDRMISYLGVDRFRIVDGMAVEEQVIFDSAVLQAA
jgi:hypothetical protein